MQTNMILTEERNFRRLSRYYIMMNLTIALVANWNVTDLLLLKMDFDLERLGIIKGNMFLLPALSYLVVSPWLSRFGHELGICAWSYLLRSTIPLVLPLLTLFCVNKEVLLWTAVVVMAVSYSCAGFANNTLMKVMRMSLSPESLNSKAMHLLMIGAFPGTILCIAVAWFLGRVGESPRAFMIWFSAIQACLLLLEFPIFHALYGIKLIHKLEKKPMNFSLRKLFSKLFTRQYTMLQVFSLVNCVWLGMVSTYFCIYLLKVKNMPASGVLWIELALNGIMFFFSGYFGKLTDRFGYVFMSAATSAAMLLIMGGWAIVPGSLILLGIMIVFVNNASSGLLAASIRNMECVGVVKLSPDGMDEMAMGVSGIQSAVGSFLGCAFFAVWLYRAVGGDLEAYLQWCSIGPLIMLGIAAIWYAVTRGRK